MMAYWSKGEALIDDDSKLATIAKMTLKSFTQHRPTLAAFFDLKDGKWFHKRIEKELENARSNSEKHSESGKKGAEKRWRKDGAAISLPLANQCQNDSSSPSPSSSPINTQDGVSEFVSHETRDENFNQLKAFDQFFPHYPLQIERISAFKVYCQYAINPAIHAQFLKAVEKYKIHLGNNPGKKIMSCHNWIPKVADWVNHVEPKSKEELKKQQQNEYQDAERKRRAEEEIERQRIEKELQDPSLQAEQKKLMEEWRDKHPRPQAEPVL
jgi:uncharacterized protein YdaU (DUF1376 family)